MLADVGRLEPGAIALTSICALNGEREATGALLRQIAATAWRTPSELSSYKARVEMSQEVMNSFGQLVN